MGKFKGLLFLILLGTSACLFRVNAGGSGAPKPTPHRYLKSAGREGIRCTRYVSPSASYANSGTGSAPWRTAQHAFDAVQPGQTISFRAGTFPIASAGRCSQT